MKRLLALLVGGLGLGELVRRRRRRAPAELGPDLAGELRAKLVESKAAAGEDTGAAGAADAAEGEGVEPPAGPEARRRDVHDQARAALDELGSG